MEKKLSKSVTFKVIGTHQLNREVKKVHAIIEKTKNGFSAYAVNAEGVTGIGNTVEQCKHELINCIERITTSDAKNIPDILKGKYEIIYQVKADQTIN